MNDREKTLRKRVNDTSILAALSGVMDKLVHRAEIDGSLINVGMACLGGISCAWAGVLNSLDRLELIQETLDRQERERKEEMQTRMVH